MLVRIGTPASFFLNQAGADYSKADKLVFGGPMMGRTAVNIDAPITKTTVGILLIEDKSEYIQHEEECIRCSRCVQGCPMGLQPYLIANSIKDDNFAELKKLNVMSCVECGCCSYSCPAKIRLLDYCRLGKAKILSKKD